MSKAPSVNIYIPVKNGADFIGDAIESILSQSYENLVLKIFDNCSTDETEEIVNSYAKSSKLFYHKNEVDVGIVNNFNNCLDDVISDYYMILSHDDLFLDNKAIEKAVQIMESDSEIVKVHADMQFTDAKGRCIMERKFPQNKKCLSNRIAKSSILSIRNMYGIPLLIKSSALGDIRYDSKLPNSLDLDFSILIGKNQCIYHINETILGIRFHNNNHTHKSTYTLFSEFRAIAIKNNIRLTFIDIAYMSLKNIQQIFSKKLFYFYLTKIR